MKRELLISEVKEEYAKLADRSSRDNFVDNTSSSIDNVKYYEELLQNVIRCVEKGAFDSCRNGREIVELVANDKSLLQ